MAQRQTVADYGLNRYVWEVEKLPLHPHYSFMRGLLDPAANMTLDDWENWDTWNAEMNYGDVCFTYSISIPLKTLVVWEATLMDEDTKVRYTEMRAWQLIIDSWMAGQTGKDAPTVAGLQYMVFHQVVEKDSKMYLNYERSQQASAGTVSMEASARGEPVVISRDGANWAKIPWLKCCDRVVENLNTMSAQQVRIVRAFAIFPNPATLVVELGPVDAGVAA